MMHIVCDHVSKTIRGAEVLHDISLELNPGTVYGLWGKNGSGKTMLLRMIAGLIRPTSGRVLADGKELWKDISFPEKMGLMIENPAFLNDETGLENLKYLAQIRGTADEKQLSDILSSVGLDPQDRRKYRKYSLGMKQRLGIACAFMEDPELVLLDEPINALDESGVLLVRKLIEKNRKEGRLIIISCHDKEEMQLLADQIFCMAEGKIEKIWTPEKQEQEQ